MIAVGVDIDERRIWGDPKAQPEEFYSSVKELWVYNPILAALPFPLTIDDPVDVSDDHETVAMLRVEDGWTVEYRELGQLGVYPINGEYIAPDNVRARF